MRDEWDLFEGLREQADSDPYERLDYGLPLVSKEERATVRMLALLHKAGTRHRQQVLTHAEARQQRHDIACESRLRIERCREEDAADIAAAKLARNRARRERLRAEARRDRERADRQLALL